MPRATVLVTLDGSKLAESGLYYLPALKRLGEFEIELLYVHEPEGAVRGESWIWKADIYLSNTAKRVQEMTGLSVKYAELSGVPYATILAEAENPRVSMIVTTTHGLTGLERWRVGSVADKVIRGAPCPTLVVGPGGTGAPAALMRLLVPLDGSKVAEEALPVAKLLAERLGATIRLVRAVTPRTVPDELAGSLTADVVESFELMAGEYLEEARLELETSQPVETVVVTGPPTEVVISQTEEAPCDLVVMTSHGRHGFVRFALGSVTDRVIGLSPAPVLVVKPGQWERFSRLASAS
jgi:nucleotide-binding universal stress UspA family protein